ncbi:cellulase [Cupriavidus pauculus]|uniref:cellulase n=1 Tax=Cupriavidus pauculus TaxID=82633 RepID=A0A5P2H8I0_9BURK|nr:cellulose synthase complex periplasmic endoglucanase BcsZ [Cupriavidus pauculus]QET03649.1 cellulase [Cupriavidus pauculus]
MANRARRRHLVQLARLGAAGAALLAAPLAACAAPAGKARAAAPCPWPFYQQFLSRFVQADGRVVDPSTPAQHSTSEGQSYGMVFALIANDRATFDRLWQWSVANLGAGNLADKLPAWQWGRRNDNSWGVIDANPASDADLWFAFALAEAARVWKAPAYGDAARALLTLVAKQEVVTLPDFGTMLLPGPQGFVEGKPDGQRTWRLNASYLPVPVLRRLAAFDRNGPWSALATQTPKFIEAVARQGIVPDWSAYRAGGARGTGGDASGFITDPATGDLSSYDAIRVYLWAGMTPAADGASRTLMRALLPNAQRMDGRAAPPEKMHADTGALEGNGPPGFSAALLPFLKLADSPALATQRARAEAMVGAPAGPAAPAYYDTVLGLFGLGHIEGRYRFGPSGQLEMEWEPSEKREGPCRGKTA